MNDIPRPRGRVRGRSLEKGLVGGWSRIDDRLDQFRAFFETAAVRLSQNEEILLMLSKHYLMLRSALGRVSKHATTPMQHLLVLRAQFLPSLSDNPAGRGTSAPAMARNAR